MGFALPTVGPPLQLRYSFRYSLRYSSVASALQLRFVQLRYSLRHSSVAAPIQLPLQLRCTPAAVPLQLPCRLHYSSATVQLPLSLRLRCSCRYSTDTAGSTWLQPPLQIWPWPCIPVPYMALLWHSGPCPCPCLSGPGPLALALWPSGLLPSGPWPWPGHPVGLPGLSPAVCGPTALRLVHAPNPGCPHTYTCGGPLKGRGC